MTLTATTMRRGLDHDWFKFRPLSHSPVLMLPSGKSLAVMVTVVIQKFRIEHPAPFAVPGGLDRPYPDLGNYSQRASGQSAALWRTMDAIESAGVPASFVVEREALIDIRDCLPVLGNDKHSIIAGGDHATAVHSDAMSEIAESEIIEASTKELSDVIGRTVLGWRSPYCAQSSRTMDLLAAHGLSYIGDFSNDDRPYWLNTARGNLLSLPMNHFYSDLHFMISCRQSVEDYGAATLNAAAVLAKEGSMNPAVLSLVVHPWVMGAPGRISTFSELLKQLKGRADVLFLNSDDIYARCSSSPQSGVGVAYE